MHPLILHRLALSRAEDGRGGGGGGACVGKTGIFAENYYGTLV